MDDQRDYAEEAANAAVLAEDTEDEPAREHPEDVFNRMHRSHASDVTPCDGSCGNHG